MTSGPPPKPQPHSPPPAVALNADGLPVNYPFNPQWEIAPRQVKQMLDSGEDFVLIDCRTPQEHAIARIDPARLVPLQDLSAHLPQLLEDQDRKIVVFCHHGGRSLRMTAALRQQGLDNARSMAGGIDLWAIDVAPSTPRY